VSTSRNATQDGAAQTVTPIPTVPWRVFRNETRAEVAYLVRGLIPVGGIVPIGAPAKAGKTWLALTLSVSSATGKAFLGRFVVPQRVHVHYLALEGSDAALRHRIGAIARGMGLDPDGEELADYLHIAYKPTGVRLLDPEYAPSYVASVQACRAQLAIIDTARRAARIRESGDGVTDLGLLAANLAPILSTTTIVPLHHAHKARGSNGVWEPPLERLSGSGDWGGLAEAGLLLDRREQSDWQDMRLDVDGRDIPAYPPMRVVYEGEPSGPDGMYRYTDSLVARCEDDDEGAGEAFPAVQVAAFIVSRPYHRAAPGKIAEAFGFSTKTLSRNRHALKRQGIAYIAAGRASRYVAASPAYAHELHPDDAARLAQQRTAE
jgi:hypothetical protein